MAKMMRLTMSEPLGRMLRDIPVHVEEQTKTECVYLGHGSLAAGLERPDVTIRVFLSGGVLKASLRSRKARLEHVGPFGTPEEQDAFARSATQAIHMGMN